MTPSRIRRLLCRLALVNGVLLLGALLYRALCRLTEGSAVLSCRVAELLGIYCPGCGGSRAVAALLRLDIVGCFFYSPFVLVAVALLLYADVVTVLALLRRSEQTLRLLHPNLLLLLPAVLLLTCLIRNILLGAGIDLLGDILPR